MKRLGLFGAVALLGVLCSGVAAQQFRISDYDGENVTIEYPPSFDGAYLFIEKSTNLVSGEWETVDYSQVTLVEGEQVLYSPPETSSGGATNIVEVPYVMTIEYIQAVSSGEITNSAWTANSSTPLPPEEGDNASYRIEAISYVDTDGDGVDNVSEYGAGTDPNVSDAPSANLPLDAGDPQPVPGSVDSAPGDWNTPLQSIYRTPLVLHEAINARILAMDGTIGTFTAQTPVATLGAWVEAQCGTWQAVAGDDLFPTVSGGRFCQTVTNGFHWAGKENVFPLALHPYDGSEGFINHLLQSDPSDPAGLALFSDGSPVLVNVSNPWTAEKLQACLKVLITVECRLQRLSGGAFDPSDITAMAQSLQQWKSETITRELTPTDTFWRVIKIAKWDWEYVNYQWLLQTSSTWYSRAQKFTFSDNLQNHGFGKTTHRGFVGITAETDWTAQGTKYSWQTNMPSRIFPDAISEVFVRSDNETCWFMADAVNYANTPNEKGNYAYGYGTFVSHKTGYDSFAYTVLSTLSPPVAPPATLVMDCDRDGTIGTNDWFRIDESHPFRFWVNEDGNAAAYPEADLEDFFPVQIMWQENTPNLTFKLSANVNLDYIPTSMTTNNTDAYLTELDIAGDLSQPGQIKSLTSGSQTSEAFAENSIILLAASGVNTNAEIYVHILENGTETAVSTNYFSFSPVAEMYRTKNLRFGGTSTTNEPANWPDELTNGKDFAFIHGFNVDESGGIVWNNTIFKRLWHSGSNARFNAVLWDGSPEETTWFDFGPYHYHNAVIHAFATAPALATYLDSLNGPVVAAHSLGNMVANEAITGNHGLAAYKVKQLYALDAAVALEAYGDSSTSNSSAMVSDNLFDRMDAGLFSDLIPIIPDFNEYEWEDYPYLAWSSEWYKLFTNNVNDARGKLTWRHRFLDIQDKTDVFNFYSSSEEVLRIDEGFVSFVSAASTKYAWQVQEHFKGRLNSNWITGIYDSMGGAASEYCGWGFVEEEPTDHIIGIGSFELAPRKPRTLHEKLANENPEQAQELAKLASDPLFKHDPAYLFGPAGDLFAAGTVATYGSHLDYNSSNATYPIWDVKITDWLIAKAFPARTRPMGSSNNSKWDEDVNVDMHVECKNPTSGLPSGDDHDEWYHNDIRKAPYLYVHRLFDQITGKE